MAEFTAIQNYLRSFALYVRKEAKANLKAEGKGGGELEKSIKFRVVKTADGYKAQLMMADYGTFLDKGVKGTKSNYIENSKTDYSYTTKQPPSGIIEKWIKKKGIKGRVDKKWKGAGNRGGQFITRKSLAFLIARSIKQKGIKSISFFSKPLNLAMENFGVEMLAAVKEDILTEFSKIKQT